jgi:hypothetical protein
VLKLKTLAGFAVKPNATGSKSPDCAGLYAGADWACATAAHIAAQNAKMRIGRVSRIVVSPEFLLRNR